MTEMRPTAKEILLRLLEEGTKARTHFQIWWTLGHLALPRFQPTIYSSEYHAFFYASRSGHYVLFFLALSKIFDNGERVASIRELKRALRAEGNTKLALEIASRLKPIEPHVKSVLGIRNRSVVHNDHAVTRQEVYELNEITPDQLRCVIDAACSVINCSAHALGITNFIFDDDRAERATLKLLQTLDRAGA